MTTPSTVNLNEVQGDDWSIEFNFIDELAYAIDLSTATITAAIRRGRTKNSPIAASFDIDMSNAATGVVVLELTSAISALLTSKTYYYDIQKSDYYGLKSTLVGGKINMQRELTSG